MSEPGRIDRELERLRGLLLSVIEKNRYTVRSLEKRLGLGVGTLRRALNGEVALTVRQTLAVVSAVGLRWEELFVAAYPLPGEVPGSLEVRPRGPSTPAEAFADMPALPEAEMKAILALLLPGLVPAAGAEEPGGSADASMPGPPIENEVRRIRELLGEELRRKGLSARGLERQVGAKGGTTRKVLHGDINLTVRHVLQYLDALGTPWREFFRKAYPGGGSHEAALERLVGRLALQALRSPRPPEPPTES